jgi:AraC family transcriptional regulator
MEARPSHLYLPEEARIIARRETHGFSLIEAVYPPRLRVSNHYHETANFCIALQGTCSELYGRKLREYRPLALDYLPAQHTHSLTFDDMPLRCFTVEIAPHMLSTLREYSLALDESLHCYGGSLAWLLTRLYNEFLQEDTASRLAIDGLMLEMLAVVSRKQTDVPEPKPPRWLQQAKEILHARFLDDLSLAAISQAVGVHSVHLSREFRRHYHSSVGEYIRKLRIEYACREMSNPDISLARIASAAGFADQSHFARTFKRFVGMTPAVFRSNLSAR